MPIEKSAGLINLALLSNFLMFSGLSPSVCLYSGAEIGYYPLKWMKYYFQLEALKFLLGQRLRASSEQGPPFLDFFGKKFQLGLLL